MKGVRLKEECESSTAEGEDFSDEEKAADAETQENINKIGERAAEGTVR